jgi:uncharacterized protein (DUF362 family)
VFILRQRRRSTPDLSIAHNTDESKAIIDGLNLIQAENLINNNDVVVITPNWVEKKKADTAVVVGPESLREVIRFAKRNNPKRIVVAAGSGSMQTTEIMKFVGFDKVIESEQVEFVDLNSGPFTRINLKHDSPSATNLNKLYEEMTFLISFTQLKMHQEATMSAAIKNIALGWPPAEEHGFPKTNLGIHNKLHGFIRAMAESIAIDLSIVSASPAMVGTGPINGVAAHTGLVVCGTDPVAVDTVGARFLGLKPQAVNYLFESINNNVGIGDIDKINMKGLPIVDAERIFSEAVYGQASLVDSN